MIIKSFFLFFANSLIKSVPQRSRARAHNKSTTRLRKSDLERWRSDVIPISAIYILLHCIASSKFNGYVLFANPRASDKTRRSLCDEKMSQVSHSRACITFMHWQFWASFVACLALALLLLRWNQTLINAWNNLHATFQCNSLELLHAQWLLAGNSCCIFKNHWNTTVDLTRMVFGAASVRTLKISREFSFLTRKMNDFCSFMQDLKRCTAKGATSKHYGGWIPSLSSCGQSSASVFIRWCFWSCHYFERNLSPRHCPHQFGPGSKSGERQWRRMYCQKLYRNLWELMQLLRPGQLGRQKVMKTMMEKGLISFLQAQLVDFSSPSFWFWSSFALF